MRYLPNDPYWDDMVFDIRPIEMPPNGYYMDFKKAISIDKRANFDLFPKKETWYSYLQGKPCRKLSEHDFLIMKDYLRRSELLVKINDVKPPETKKPKDLIGEVENNKSSLHDSFIDSLVTIGEIFGFESIRKPSVNDLRPEGQPFKAKDKALDLAWKIFGLTYVPFEVQVHGSVPDLIYRLHMVHQWSLKIVVIADEEWHEEILEAAQVYPFAGKLVLIKPKEIESAKSNFEELKKLRQKIFE
jgi:hypothetical protein